MLTPTLLYDPFMHRTDFGSDSVFPTWVDVSHVRLHAVEPQEVRGLLAAAQVGLSAF